MPINAFTSIEVIFLVETANRAKRIHEQKKETHQKVNKTQR